MKYALVNDERQEAQPKLLGKCRCCDNPVIAKCGTVRVSHWAHKGKLECDQWWENETPWHREWKNRFPKEWQEVVHSDNGEKHIADVKTNQGWVIEFQHSPIKPEERKSRETFYKKMIWIVNGTRRPRDKDKFILALERSRVVDNQMEVIRLDYFFGDECALIRDWSNSKVLVFFDFGEDILWGLLPKTNAKPTYTFKIDRNKLIECLLSESHISFEELLKPIIDSINSFIKKEQENKELQEWQQSQHTNYFARNNGRNRFQNRHSRL